MPTYNPVIQKIHDRLVERFAEGNEPAIAEKGARLVIDIAYGYESRDLVRRRFSRQHHEFIERCLAELREPIAEEEEQTEQAAEEWRSRFKDAIAILKHYQGDKKSDLISTLATYVADCNRTIEDAIEALTQPE